MNAVSTDKIENELSEITNISDYIKNNQKKFNNEKLSDHLNKLLGAKDMSVADVVSASGLNKGYVYQIFEGCKENPSRDKLLAIAVGMKLDYGDVQKLMKVACMRPLYARDEHDAIIIFAVKNKKSIDFTNATLTDHGFKALY
ncbi:MAG: XRE family transcriptional regulator [Oscillospiraceae bacterium]